MVSISLIVPETQSGGQVVIYTKTIYPIYNQYSFYIFSPVGEDRDVMLLNYGRMIKKYRCPSCTNPFGW